MTPAHLLCFCVFQVFFHSYVNKVTFWLTIFLVILSNEEHFNPRPHFLVILSNEEHFNPRHHFQNNFFNFTTWNANSSVKDNVERVRLIPAHNSIFNYDIISICETSLNNPSNSRHGVVGVLARIACLLLSEMICRLTSQYQVKLHT